MKAHGFLHSFVHCIVATGTAFFAAIVLTLAPARAEKRVALVVGNSAYVSEPRLANPVNDARLMAETLHSVGFTIVDGGAQLNLSEDAFRKAVVDFGKQLEGADVGLFYYAGHGVQVRGSNYLVPVDASPTREADVDFQMLDTNLVLRQMEGAGTRLNVVILDACRNNPLAGRGLRSIATGLASMQSPEGTLISFATQPGSVAEDGSDGHSPYTEALARTMRKPGLDIFQTFNAVGLQVAAATGGAQQPWVSISPISGDFYFAGPVSIDAKVTVTQPQPAPDPAVEAWATTKDTTSVAVLEDFIRHFGATVYGSMARARLEELKNAQVAVAAPSAAAPIDDPGLLAEMRERLYELNFDPGPLDGTDTEATRKAVREFQQQSNEQPTGIPTTGLLRQLRDAGSLKPWGAIVYDKDAGKWGISWDEPTRTAAVASARASCGSATSCPAEISFFGGACGAFAHSASGWAIAARGDITAARQAALAECGEHGRACEIVASVCASGKERYTLAK